MKTNYMVKIKTAPETYTSAEILFFAGWLFYTIYLFLASTMFITIFPMDDSVRNAFRLNMYAMVILKMFYCDRFSLKKTMVYGVILLVFLFSALISGYAYQFDYMFLALGAYGVKNERLLKLYVKFTISLTLIVIVSSFFGIIENRQFFRTSGTVRNCFGFIYTTDFAAHIFYILLAVSCLKGKKFKFRDMGIYFLIAAAILFFCDARLDAGLIILMAIGFMLYAKTRLFNYQIFKNILLFATPVCCFFSIAVTALYRRSAFWKAFDSLTTGRLSLGWRNLKYYGIKPFGQYIFQQGHGVLDFNSLYGYNFVDCGFLQVALEYGSLVLILVVAAAVFTTYRFLKKGRTEVALAIFFVALTSCFDHHILEIGYNPFLMMVFASITPAVSGETYALFRKKEEEKEEEIYVAPVPVGLTYMRDVWYQVFKDGGK